jgi:hypothetical protein
MQQTYLVGHKYSSNSQQNLRFKTETSNSHMQTSIHLILSETYLIETSVYRIQPQPCVWLLEKKKKKARQAKKPKEFIIQQPKLRNPCLDFSFKEDKE